MHNDTRLTHRVHPRCQYRRAATAIAGLPPQVALKLGDIASVQRAVQLPVRKGAPPRLVRLPSPAHAIAQCPPPREEGS